MIQFQAPVKGYASDLVHTGSEVLVLREHCPDSNPMLSRWAVDALNLTTGAYSRGRSLLGWERCPEAAVPVGPEVIPLMPYPSRALRGRPLPTAEALVLAWGWRYADFDSLALLEGRPVAVRVPIRTGDELPAQGLAPTFSPVRTRVWRGPRGGLLCRPEIIPTVNDTLTGRLARGHVADLASLINLPPTGYNPFNPSSLLTTADGKTVHIIYRDGGVAKVEREMQLVSTLEQPPKTDSNPLSIPIDAKTSPDGQFLYVSWEGYRPSDGGLSVYRTADYAAVTHYKFEAGLLAPSPDGLSLAFLDGFGGRLNRTTVTVIDLC